MAGLLKTIENTLNTTTYTIKQTVKANLGVYGIILEEAKNTSDKATTLFNTMVERGTKVEPQVKEKAAGLLESIEAKVQAKKQSVTASLIGTNNQQLNELDKKLDRLTNMVNKLNAKMHK